MTSFCQKTRIGGWPLVFPLLTVLEVFGILRLKNRPKKIVPQTREKPGFLEGYPRVSHKEFFFRKGG